MLRKLFGIGIEKKASAIAQSLALTTAGVVQWTPREYDKLAREGYLINVIGYRCIKEFSESFATIPWVLKKGDEVIEDHPLLDLLRNPSPSISGQSFWRKVASFYKISGNSYIEAIVPKSGDGVPTELNVLRPDRMKVVPNALGVVGSYEHTVNGNKTVWVNDPKTGRGLIWHLKDFHPLHDWYGMSAMEAAAYGIDQHNAASVHNAAFLQNSMRPASLFTWKADPGQTERKRFEALLIERFEGPTKSGKPIVVGGDMTYTDIGSTMRDADFIEGKIHAVD